MAQAYIANMMGPFVIRERRRGISPASASEHTAALRATRLVDSRRDGKAVIHHATGLGVDLLDVNRR